MPISCSAASIPRTSSAARMKLDAAAARQAVGTAGRGARPGRSRRRRWRSAHRRQQHDGRAALGADRARPRSARLHAVRLRRRHAAACERADPRDGHPARASCRSIRRSSRPTDSSSPNARVDRQRTTQLTSKFFEAERANEIMDALVSESLAELAAQGYRADIEVHRALEMRYLGQNYELELPLTQATLQPTIPSSSCGRCSTTPTRRASASARPARSSRS